ncbi:MAG: hypothetical protein Pg6C_01700 [Treponemataceae bacterium]|nr:MAG: hypothetical protein Pg6C_01700 [Treponemataceae bacterium]
MKLTIERNPSAFKHGVTLADIRSAFDNRLFERPVAGNQMKYGSNHKAINIGQ